MRPAVGGKHPGGTWAWFLVLLLFATLGVHVWPQLVPWRFQTLHRDLPYVGLCLVVVAMIGRFRPLRRRLDAFEPPRRKVWWTLAAGTGVLAVLVALPTMLAVGRAGLTFQIGERWGVPGGAADPHPARRLDFGLGSGGIWRREAFFAVMSGWVYVPAEGTYHIALDVDADGLIEMDGHAVVGRGAPPGLKPPGVTDGVTGFRRARVDLETGFHSIRVLSRHEAGSARLRVRWILPWLSRAIMIPAEHLLPLDVTPRVLWLRGVALAGRRIGVVGLFCLGLGALSLALSVLGARGDGWVPARVAWAGHAGFGLVFLMLTGIPLLIWDEQGTIVAPLLLGACVAGPLATAGLTLLRRRAGGLLVARRWPGWVDPIRRGWPVLALLVVQVTLTVRFLAFVHGRLPMPGDHSSFLYRYHALLHTLPRLRFYDPWWNAGSVDPSPALSGSTALLVLASPLLAIWRLPEAYPAFIPIVGVVLAPWSLFATVRLLGGSSLAALLAALLVLAPGDYYFWWFMAHGTLPAIVSAALAPLVVALAWRVFGHHDQRWILVLMLAASLAIGLFWVGFVLMIGPPLVIGAVAGRRGLHRRDVMLATVVTTGVLLVHAHWLLGLIWFPELPHMAPPIQEPLTWRSYVVDRLLPVLSDPNPIALALGSVGTFLLPRPLRAIYGGFVLSLLAMVTLVHPLASRLELDRFLVAFGIALIPPAAWMAARLLRAAGRGFSGTLSPLVGMGVLAVLVLHLDGVWRQYAGQIRRTARQIEFMSQPTRELVDWIRTSASSDGRTLIVGDLPGPSRLEGGYKAYLQPLTGRALMGYHVNPKWVDMQVGLVLQGPDVRGALEAFNIRQVIIGDDQSALREQLDNVAGLRFREGLSRFLVYEVDGRSTYLVDARGTVAFDYDRLDVRLEDRVEGVTLKFRWALGLVSDPPLLLEPIEILPGVRFIRVHTVGVRSFRIRYTDCCAWLPVEMWARWRDRGS